MEFNSAALSVSFSADTGELLVRVQEAVQGTEGAGKFVTFAGASLRPLGYAELLQANPDSTLSIPIDLDDARLLDTNVEGLDGGLKYTAKAPVFESHFTSRAIGLVKGGWLPPALAANNNTVNLIDRNIVSQIVGRFENGKTVGGDPDFLDLFANRPLKINPVLFAMEGNTRSTPTPEQVRRQLDEFVAKFRAALPETKLVVDSDVEKGILGSIEDTRAGFAKRQKFIVSVAPSLVAPVARAKVHTRTDEVLSIADQCGVSRGSLVVLAALSVVFVANGASPAKRLLKIRTDYRDKDAYNALVDLRSLEMLIYVFALFPGLPAILWTADKDLALFWVGIQASNFKKKGAGVSCDLSPIDALLPGFANEWPNISRSSRLPD